MKSSARIAVVLILFAASASHAQVLVGQMNPRAEVFFNSSVAGTLIDLN
jgi:hypothetical protein